MTLCRCADIRRGQRCSSYCFLLPSCNYWRLQRSIASPFRRASPPIQAMEYKPFMPQMPAYCCARAALNRRAIFPCMNGRDAKNRLIGARQWHLKGLRQRHLRLRPQCLVEVWSPVPSEEKMMALITTRGFGSTMNAQAWQQLIMERGHPKEGRNWRSVAARPY